MRNLLCQAVKLLLQGAGGLCQAVKLPLQVWTMALIAVSSVPVSVMFGLLFNSSLIHLILYVIIRSLFPLNAPCRSTGVVLRNLYLRRLGYSKYFY